MESTPRREELFISLFISAYEKGSWADAEHCQPDKIERTKQAIDWFAKRKSDGKTLAIEHTIIEPFVGEKGDFASFGAAFLGIERDTSLPVPERSIQVFVPVGTLENQPTKAAREAIVDSVHRWIKLNRLGFRDGSSEHRCTIEASPGNPLFDITLHLKVVPLRSGPGAEGGILHVRRQQVEDSLDRVVSKALRKKLPKLVETVATKRILLLERQHMNLYPKRILDEIWKQNALFSDLGHIDEIWIVESMFYGTDFGGTYVRFELYEKGVEVKSFDFNGGKLVMRVESQMGEIIEP
jgi:hypothetical protein